MYIKSRCIKKHNSEKNVQEDMFENFDVFRQDFIENRQILVAQNSSIHEF